MRNIDDSFLVTSNGHHLLDPFIQDLASIISAAPKLPDGGRVWARNAGSAS